MKSCFGSEATFNRGPLGRHKIGKTAGVACRSAATGVDGGGDARAATVGLSSELLSAADASKERIFRIEGDC